MTDNVLNEAKHFATFTRRQFIPKFHLGFDMILDVIKEVLSVAMGVFITILWASADGMFDLRLGILLMACLLAGGYALADFLFARLKTRWEAYAAKLREAAQATAE